MLAPVSTFLNSLKLLLRSFKRVRPHAGPNSIELRQRVISPSPLRSGGEGRGEEAPSGLVETNPSPPALSPLRSAGRGKRPTSLSTTRLDSMAVHPGPLPQERGKHLRSSWKKKLLQPISLILPRKSLTVLWTSLGLVSGMQPAFPAPMAISAGQSAACVCPACPKACCISKTQNGSAPAPVTAQARATTQHWIGIPIRGTSFPDRKNSPSLSANDSRLLDAGSFPIPLYRRHCAYLI